MNYKDLEYDFIERTLALIKQYKETMDRYTSNEQYIHTLLINCLLGLIVLPKERTRRYLPNDRLTADLIKKMGLENSTIDQSITRLPKLIKELRDSVAHWDIEVLSLDDKNTIDEIVFKNNGKEIARFSSKELLKFIHYYSDLLLSNLKNHKH